MNLGHPNDAKVIDLSQQSNFVGGRQGGESDVDPAEPRSMRVDVDRIKPFDRNPRRAPNSARDDIKESIRASRMDQPLTITRRPGDEHYMVAAGGNTRLQVMQELWHETNDARYRQAHCLFRPWSSDGDVLVAHLTENDLRGNLTFLDRALAVQDLRDLLEDEIGEELSQAGLVKALTDRGYRTQRSLIQRYEYAVDVLYPAIPTLLERGLGRPQVERLAALQRAYSAIWEALDLGAKDSAEEIFIAVLARFEELGALDFDGLRLDLCDELSVCSDRNAFTIRNAFDAALEGRPLRNLQATASPEPGQPPGELPDSSAGTSVPPASESAQSQAPSPASSADAQLPTEPAAPSAIGSGPATAGAHAFEDKGDVDPSPRRSSATDADSQTLDGPSAGSGGANAKPTSSPDDLDPELGQERAVAVEAHLNAPSLHSDLQLSGDLQALRRDAWQAAVRFAAETRIGDIVIRLPEMGLGFLVGPADESMVANCTDEEVRQTIASWWSLAILSEQFARHGAAVRYVPAAWRERPIGEAMRQARTFRAWTEAEANQILEVITEVPIIGMPDMALGFLGCSESAWSSWTQVAASCRAIHQATSGHPWVQS